MFRSEEHELLSDLLFAFDEWQETIEDQPEFAADADEILTERVRDVKDRLCDL